LGGKGRRGEILPLTISETLVACWRLSRNKKRGTTEPRYKTKDDRFVVGELEGGRREEPAASREIQNEEKGATQSSERNKSFR